MDSAPPLDVPFALAALRSRSARELARMQGVAAFGTEFVGGWAKVGSCLDVLLRNAFCVACMGVGRAVDVELQRLSRQPSWLTSKATAGQLRFVLPLLVREVRPHDPLLRAVSDACDDARSPLRRAIEVRNAMVHDQPLPPTAELSRLLSDLVAWCDARG